jgi:purine-binding chemotaxis protein CheW
MSSARSAEAPGTDHAWALALQAGVEPRPAASREQILDAIRRLETELLDMRRQLAATFSGQRLPRSDFMVLRCHCATLEVGFLLDSLVEVVMLPALCPLPEAPPWVAGVLNLRGKSIPVLDVTARVANTSRELEVSDYVVVCTGPQGLVGLVVQDLGEPTLVAPGDVSRPSDGLNVAPYLLGLVQHDGSQVALLDVGALVAFSGIVELAA